MPVPLSRGRARGGRRPCRTGPTGRAGCSRRGGRRRGRGDLL